MTLSGEGAYAIETDRKLLAAGGEDERARKEAHVYKVMRGFVLGSIDLTNIQRLMVLILLRQLGKVVLLVFPLGVEASIEMNDDILSFVKQSTFVQPWPRTKTKAVLQGWYVSVSPYVYVQLASECLIRHHREGPYLLQVPALTSHGQGLQSCPDIPNAASMNISAGTDQMLRTKLFSSLA